MPDEITTEYMESEEEKPAVYAQAVRRTVTMYPEQWRAVDTLARERCRGKTSPALQKIVDWFMDQVEGIGADFFEVGL